MSTVRSMTGFASVVGTSEDETPFTLTIKGVNHRFLDLHLRLPGGLDGLEMQLRRLLKERLRRGHVEVTLTVERAGGGGLRWNEAMLGEYVRVFREAAAAHGLTGEPELNAMLRLPGVFGSEPAARVTLGSRFEAAVLTSASEALTAFEEVRATEGASLVRELRRSVDLIGSFREELAEFRAGVRAAQMERLRQRVGELLGGVLGDERLLTEVAILVERSDVQEELVRLQTHVERFVKLLDGGGEVGKAMDFLLQELNREANTLLSKTSGVPGEAGLRITEIGLAMKVEIERAREQIQNLE